MSTLTGKERRTAAVTARQAATRRLIAAHQTEFELMHGDERVRRGLPRPVDKVSRIAVLEQQVARLEEENAKLRADRQAASQFAALT